MYNIEIKHQTSTIEEMVNTLRSIANQIELGNSSGYYPTWTLTNETDKQNKIDYIKRVLSDWGMVTTGEMELGHSPVYNSLSKDHYMLVEEFTQDYVRVVEYVHESITNEIEVEYENLDDDLIDEITTIIENYEADNFKTEKRINN